MTDIEADGLIERLRREIAECNCEHDVPVDLLGEAADALAAQQKRDEDGILELTGDHSGADSGAEGRRGVGIHSTQSVDGLIERLWHTNCDDSCAPTRAQAADALAAQQRRYQDEYEIVDRVWKALGITTYEGANGKAIYEIVAEQKAALAAAEKRAKEYADLYMDRCEKWSALRETLATKEKRIMELERLVEDGLDDEAS